MAAAPVAVFLTAMFFMNTRESVAYEAKVWQPDEMSPKSQTYALARFIDVNLPHDAIVGSYNSGVIGYYSNRKVVNLDGLVNNFEYYNRVLAKGWPRSEMLGYMKDSGIDYFADFQMCQSCTDPEILRIASKNTGVPIDHLALVKVLPTDEVGPVPDPEGRPTPGAVQRTILYLVQVK